LLFVIDAQLPPSLCGGFARCQLRCGACRRSRLADRDGNAGNRSLIAKIMRALPAIVGAIERGEAVIEFVGG
jgi:hypothetical protein